MTWMDAAEASLPLDSVVAVEAGGTLVALARSAGGWHAVEAWCTHAECPLSDGWVEGSAIRCPCHGSLFDLATGRPLEGPAEDSVRVFPTRVLDARVEIEIT
jgi:3-phenylpropionate/trans-cinnamate dioxygenase ferredoxin subunit